MPYLNRESSIRAILKIQQFLQEISTVYEKHGMNLERDVGRKNIIASLAQEHFFAEAIRETFPDCFNDGRTGKADILINSTEQKELECKIVSESTSGGWDLRADISTLTRKEKCDFLYLLFDREHTKVALFLFEDLKIEDFHKPSLNSRNKARMKYSQALMKCTPLIGAYIDVKQEFLEKYEKKSLSAKTDLSRIRALQKKKYWDQQLGCFRFQLENLNDLKRI